MELGVPSGSGGRTEVVDGPPQPVYSGVGVKETEECARIKQRRALCLICILSYFTYMYMSWEHTVVAATAAAAIAICRRKHPPPPGLGVRAKSLVITLKVSLFGDTDEVRHKLEN